MNKVKLNVLDLSIIIVLVIVIATVGFIYFNKNNNKVLTDEKKTIQFDITVSNIPLDVAQSYKIDSTVVFGKANVDTGIIKNVKIEPYRKLMKDEQNGKYIWTTYADMYQATVTIETAVHETENSFKNDKESIVIGVEMPFRGKGFASANGFVVDIRD